VVSGRDGAAGVPACPVDALHDSVIQRLFATALQLQSALGHITDATARQRVRQSVDVLDEIIGEVRSALHDGRSP
jgi:signal transduction histidine kinase